MTQQLSLFGGESFILPEGGPAGPALAVHDPLPPGPYALSMLWDAEGCFYTPPFCVVAANGQAVAGWIDSLAAAVAIRDALNRHAAALAVPPRDDALPQLPQPIAPGWVEAIGRDWPSGEN